MLVGGVILPAPAVPTSTRISARMNGLRARDRVVSDFRGGFYKRYERYSTVASILFRNVCTARGSGAAATSHQLRVVDTWGAARGVLSRASVANMCFELFIE